MEELRQLRQTVQAMLDRARGVPPPVGCSHETIMQLLGVQAGSVAMLESVLDEIDKILREG